MKVSIFDSVHDTRPQTVEVDWADFAENLGPHDTTYDDKMSVPGFCPAEWPAGSTRSKRGVLRVHFGVLDLDKLPDAKFDELLPLLEGLSYIFYTTWSHVALVERGLWAARLVIPFTRPVLASEWSYFWPRFNARFGNMGDPSCKDPSRLYFIPSAPPGSNGASQMLVGKGALLDVDELLGMDVPLRVDEETPETIQPAQVRDFAKGLQRRKSGYYKSMGARILQMLEGKPFAEPGERDDIIFKLSCLLVEEWPRVNAHNLAQLFATSLAIMRDQSRDCPDLESVEEKIRRHQVSVLEDQAATQADEMRARKRLLRAALGREYPYTDEELATFAERSECTRFDFDKRWVIQKDKTYYIYKAGSYCAPVSRHEFIEAAERDLAPASSAGVELYKVNQQGEITPRTPTELMRYYGLVARRVAVDMTAQYSRFDARTETIIEAPCPMRTIEPEQVPEVDEWVRALAGDEAEKLLDWMAVVTSLNEPCAALYFEGPPGTGKTMFADGMSRIWTQEGPSTLEQAFASFNDGIARCPLVLADEMLPKDFKGAGKTGELRQFIQGRVRPLKRKFMPDATLHGCVRLVITANNKDLLASRENLSSSDIDAIIDRILYISCSADARHYLQSLPHETLLGFVRDDLLAKHALWLRDNRDVKRGHRFLIAGENSTLHRSLTTSAGLRSAVCHWLVSYLLEPTKIDTTKTLLVRVHKGKLLATTRGMIKYWQMYETNEDPPPAGPLSKALAGLSKSGKHQLTAGDGRRTNYWRVSTSNLLTWADNNGYADIEELHALLEDA